MYTNQYTTDVHYCQHLIFTLAERWQNGGKTGNFKGKTRFHSPKNKLYKVKQYILLAIYKNQKGRTGENWGKTKKSIIPYYIYLYSIFWQNQGKTRSPKNTSNSLLYIYLLVILGERQNKVLTR